MTTSRPRPPVAKRVPTQLTTHGHVRVDDYLWMHDREDPEVIAYLNAENEYTEQCMAETAELREKLFEEIKGRIKQTDMSVPYRIRDWYYYTRYEDGQEYPLHARKRSLDGEEHLMLDVNELAKEHEYYAIAGSTISWNQDILAYAEDTVGRRLHTIRFKNLTTGETYPDAIPGVAASLAWANDNQTLFYVRKDPVTLRPYQVYRHRLGSDPADDELVYEERDDTFIVQLGKTRSRQFLVISCYQTVSTEVLLLDANQPEGEFRVVTPRRRDHEYGVDHFRGRFYILTNHEAQNFRLMHTSEDRPEESSWEELIGHRDDVLITDFEIFQDHLVVSERERGLARLRVRPWDGSDEHYLAFDEPAYLAYVSTNPEPDTQVLRFGYTSLTTPNSIYDYDMATREKTLLKRQEVVGEFDPADYVTERFEATAEDGTRIPISYVVRRDRRDPEGTPLLLYAYGSYGISMDPTFSSARLSLLDRGFAFAIAHIRGGEELGRAWYETGKLLHKQNTFADFITCSEFVLERKLAGRDQLYAMGGSAGGLLMGAVINKRPELYAGIIAAVPFVDIVTTMLDDSIPLTTGEYDEWGNPNDKTFYEYMLSYSPYDNVAPREVPPLLVTSGLHDSQVQYWEPTKWVAKLRQHAPEDATILLKTNMEAGHSGATGRFKAHKDTAFEYAFLLNLAGKTA